MIGWILLIAFLLLVFSFFYIWFAIRVKRHPEKYRGMRRVMEEQRGAEYEVGMQKFLMTNYLTTGKYSKGHFLLENDEKCMLFVRHKMTPYIEIRTTDNLYYLNGATEEETMELFGKLKETMNAKLSVASRHCEERSNPDKELHSWIASSCLLAMTQSACQIKPLERG